MHAKGLKESEKNQLRRLLDTKLKEAHTQYLAKNPMQLTILLSLIHNRGASLPEKRTAMYDAYMDMFFSRESEKSDVVRDNRDVLIDIHRFLAWKLQTAAEAGNNGSIEYSDLRATLFSYLDKEGEDTTIVDALFNGIIERVGALVSRVQDTYEFEVQPLREYFVAKYLYETSPYPSGEGDATGDKFDRFNALIRNPYWLNVTRFYGGCFNKGEILTLVNELVELAKTSPYDRTSHVRSIALMLLGDWVFTQYQPGVKSVVNFITDYPQLRQLLASVDEPGTGLWGVLPERSGRADFISILFDRIVRTQYVDERRALAQIINQNATAEERFDYWQQAQSKMLHLEWAKLGALLDVYATANEVRAGALLATKSEAILSRFVESRCFTLLEKSDCADEARKLILFDAKFSAVAFDGSNPHRLNWLALICGAFQYGSVFDVGAVSLRSFLESRAGRDKFLPRSATPENLKLDELPEPERGVVLAYLAFIDNSTELLSSTLAPWTELVTALRQALGDSPAFDRIAVISAGIRSKIDLGSDGDLSATDDIVSTARFARLKSGAHQWWRDRLSGVENVDARVRWLLLLWFWATPRTLMKLASFLDGLLADLSNKEWTTLSREFYFLSTYVRRSDEASSGQSYDLTDFEKFSSRVCSFVRQRLPLKPQLKLAQNVANDPSAEAPEVQFALEAVVRSCLGESNWEGELGTIKALYSRGAYIPLGIRRNFEVPAGVASEVSREPESFPLPLVAAADGALRAEAGSKSVSLQAIAARDKWFR
ncbi:NACHT domain-containing protein [Bradyrhizobium zhanjiangense]|uniref:NACHT domain-containing protein n=1 Tax=Bradyrhizobium zhanjiangense TaxID=1325107 RepID=UPI00100899C7|nr:hypothetical protein [Bradyrhizobium zhanjiangense]